MTGPAIEARSVSKWFGDVVAVSDVSFEVQPGVTGLLGPNGAGKTTLLHVISGLARPSQGEAFMLGERVWNNPEVYRRVGFVSEHESAYGFYTGSQFVELSACLFGLPDPADAADRAIGYVAMEHAQSRKIDTYSRGMRQRIRLAAAIVHEPEVLLLDEPLNGTDPRQRVQFQELMRKMVEDEGRTVLISSHILEEVESVADRILLMVGGKLAAAGDFRAIRAKLDEQPYRVRIVASEPRRLAAALVRMDELDSISVDDDGALIALSRNVGVLQTAVPKSAAELGIRILRVEPLDESLESVFSYVVER